MDKWLTSSNATKVIKTSLNLVPEESVDDPEPFTVASTRSNATKVIKKSLNLVDEYVDNKVKITVSSGNTTSSSKIQWKMDTDVRI